MEEILNINNITKKYGSLTAVNELSFSVKRGDVFGILGPNGSGKTTTLAIILGVISSNNGSFNWFGNDDLSSAKKKIGSLLETPNFYPYLSIEKNLKIVAQIKDVDESDIDRVLKLVNLFERKSSAFMELSLGMKQRLALAGLLLGDPEVLILDEPTNGLDPEGIAEVREIILDQAKRNKTIIIASHILDEVEKVCSHVAVLKKGQLVANGRVSELLGSSVKIKISTSDLNGLRELIVRNGYSTDIEIEGKDMILSVEDTVKPAEINELAFKNGFVLSKLEVHKNSLENQFLEIVNSK